MSTCGRAATSACSSGTTTAWTGSTRTPARRSAAARTPTSGNAHPVGADTREILASVAGYPPEEIDRLFAAGAVGTGAPPGQSGPQADPATRIERGELSRVDPEFRHRLAAAKGRR